MIVLDTNVVSETMKPRPDPAVVAWLNALIGETVYLSSITFAELLFGVGNMSRGSRRDRFAARLDLTRAELAGRILPFDESAAETYAGMAVTARAAGRPLPPSDGYIAAIAASRGFAVATRNTRHFADTGVDVIDPWA